MQSAAPVAYETQLRPVLRERALRLPEGYNQRTLALARQWRREAGDDDAAIAERALAWNHSDFNYPLRMPLPGRHLVDEYLFDPPDGFCEHFSSDSVGLIHAVCIPIQQAGLGGSAGVITLILS